MAEIRLHNGEREARNAERPVGFSPDDTIVAVATPQGRGGIGVVRIAGPQACSVAAALIDRADPLEARHATLVRVLDRSHESHAGVDTAGGLAIDSAVATWFAAPHSYTGDDVVEISAHGSPVILHRIVELAMRAGARLAEPGEFTFRAYLNGRINLAQAEAVADLVDAVTPKQARAAMDQLEGTLTSMIATLDGRLFDLAARLEASLDFPDEGFHFVTPAAAREELTTLVRDLDALIRDGRRGRVLREGRLVVLVGPPNAGKSSLFNVLAGAARAIVTEIPGTTRDLLTERIDLGGVPVTIVDTAGLRESPDVIEAEGVARAKQAREVAALSLVVLDRSQPWSQENERILAETPEPRIVVMNKRDLDPAWTRIETERTEHRETADDSSMAGAVAVSATTGDGVDRLRAAIVRALLNDDELRDTPAISNVRHLELVERAKAAVEKAIETIDRGETEELILVELSAARQALEAISGRRDSEDLLRHIFSRFCIGK